MEYSGSEVRVVGLLWKGGGADAEPPPPPLPRERWLPREVLYDPELLKLPYATLMDAKREADALEREARLDLGLEPDADAAGRPRGRTESRGGAAARLRGVSTP